MENAKLTHALFIPSEGAVLDSFIADCCRQFGADAAFVDGDVSISFDELWEKSAALAGFLSAELGATKGTRVAVVLSNVIEFPICTAALMQIGAIQVNTNPHYTARELTHQLNDAEVKIAIATTASLPVLLSAQVPSLEAIILTDSDASVGQMLLPSSAALFALQDIVSGNHKPAAAPSHSEQDIAFLQYTGGTTGASKGAMLTHANIVANIRQFLMLGAAHFTQNRPNVLTAIPLYHVFGLTVNMLSMLGAGGKNVLISNPRDIPSLVSQWSRHGINFFTGVNTLFKALNADPQFRGLELNTGLMTMGGGAAVQDVVSERWRELTGNHIRQGYGLSETSPVVTCVPFDDNMFLSSIGYPLQDTEVRIRNEEDQDVSTGATGELCVRGPQVMKGYWRRPEATAAVMTPDGFFRTGDMARMDEDGRYYIVDRKKDMILVSGFNVYPNEVEAVVSEIAGVAECAAIGVPDDNSGEAVAIFVVKGSLAVDEHAIRQHCRTHLAAYKVPRHVLFLKDMPKSGVGKILRRELRNHFSRSDSGSEHRDGATASMEERHA